MRGVYFFANFGENFSQGPYQIWGMRKSEKWASKLLLEIGFPISTFGLDEKGNLYVANIENGIIYQNSRYRALKSDLKSPRLEPSRV
jgi:hypothetical protein